MDDLSTLRERKDHLGVLRHVRSNKLREPTIVVEHGTALLGPDLRRSRGLDESERLAVLEQLCTSAADVQNHTLADKCLAEIRKTVPKDSARFRRLLGLCLEAVGDLDGATKEYDDLLSENPSNGFALKRKYCILRSQPGKDVEAREALNAYLGQNGGDPAGWAELGRLCHDAGDYKAAAYAWEEVVLACPLSTEVHCTLGELYATTGGLGNLRLARRHLAQSLELDPNNVRALYALVAVASSYLDEYERAGKSKREAEEDDVEVAKELVKFGAEKLVKLYKGTKMAKVVGEILDAQRSEL